jgi:hypothetical protein
VPGRDTRLREPGRPSAMHEFLRALRGGGVRCVPGPP